MLRHLGIALAALLVVLQPLNSAELKPPLEAPPGYEHGKWGTEPKDIVRTITAFTVSFDSADDRVRIGFRHRCASNAERHSSPAGAAGEP
jgi:hypothetical protein